MRNIIKLKFYTWKTFECYYSWYVD